MIYLILETKFGGVSQLVVSSLNLVLWLLLLEKLVFLWRTSKYTNKVYRRKYLPGSLIFELQNGLKNCRNLVVWWNGYFKFGRHNLVRSRVDLTWSLLVYQKGIECHRIPENTVVSKTVDTKWIDPFYATGLFLYLLKISKNERLSQASAYEKQGRATIARLVTKFRGYRRVKSRTPPTK